MKRVSAALAKSAPLDYPSEKKFFFDFLLRIEAELS